MNWRLAAGVLLQAQKNEIIKYLSQNHKRDAKSHFLSRPVNVLNCVAGILKLVGLNTSVSSKQEFLEQHLVVELRLYPQSESHSHWS